MKLGFTGTRNGMTDAQRATFTALVADKQPVEFHHGDCVGADADAHDVVTATVPGCIRVIRPGPASDLSANRIGDVMKPAASYFTRNRHIVDSTDALIACPPCKPFPSSGGTAYTIGYAAKQKKPCVIIWPDGSRERVS